LGLNIRWETDSLLWGNNDAYGAQLPFRISEDIVDESQYDSLCLPDYQLQADASGYRIINKDDDTAFRGLWGMPLRLPGINLILSLKPSAPVEFSYKLNFLGLNAATNGYRSALVAEIPKKQVSIINLSIENSNR